MREEEEAGYWGLAGGGQEEGAGGGSDVRFVNRFLNCGFVSQVAGCWGSHGLGSKLA